jgi:hypothetical protein
VNKNLLVIVALLCIYNSSKAQINFDPSLPIMVSDNAALEGIGQYTPLPAGPFIWQRPSYNSTNLSMFMGGLAVNPNNLSQVFFTDNSATNKLYIFNRAASTASSVETFTGNSFTGATQGTNASAILPLIESENVFGINMMVINGSNNTGYAISKNKTLYTFGISSPYTITNMGVITDAPGNTFLYSNSEGGGIMINTDNRLTALVNFKYYDPTLGLDTFKYCFFDIDPITLKAKYLNQTKIGFYGFQDNTSFVTGIGITNAGSTSMYCSVYDRYNTGSGVIYKYMPATNQFGDGTISASSVYLYTGNNSFGDLTGVGKTSIKAVVPMLDFIWQGTTSTNWNTASNWNKNAVPTSTDPVILVAGTPFAPALNTPQTVKSLTINTGVTFTNTVTLSITGACTNNGTLAGTGLIALSGTATQTLSGTGSFKKFTVNAGANVAVAAGSNLKFQ